MEIVRLKPDDSDLGTVRIVPLPHEASRVFDQFKEESDRGTALVGVAYVDEQLKQLFRAKMLNEKKILKLLEGYEPLATFAARIDCAYGFGWIGPKTYRDLSLLKKIRNEFAHAHERLTFSSSSIRNRCLELECPKALESDIITSKDKFCFTVSILALQLAESAKSTPRAQLGLDVYPCSQSDKS